jgi:hypothetical protein
MNTHRFIVVLALAGLLAPVAMAEPGAAAAPKPEPGKVAAPKPAALTLKLDKALVMGASVSAGFGTVWTVEVPRGKDDPAEGPAPTRQSEVTLADMLAAASADPSARPELIADKFFFSSPDKVAKRQFDRMMEAKPSVVFAVDYLFWHAYGVKPSERRKAMVIEGLERLAKVEGPIVIGDIPNMRHARFMISEQQMPSEAQHEEFNQLIRDWAKERKNVVVVSLFDLVKKARAGERIEMGGVVYEGAKSKGLLAADGLHATAQGMAALAGEALKGLEEKKLLPAGAVWERDPAIMLRRLRPAALSEGAEKPAREPVPAGAGK